MLGLNIKKKQVNSHTLPSLSHHTDTIINCPPIPARCSTPFPFNTSSCNRQTMYEPMYELSEIDNLLGTSNEVSHRAVC